MRYKKLAIFSVLAISLLIPSYILIRHHFEPSAEGDISSLMNMMTVGPVQDPKIFAQIFPFYTLHSALEPNCFLNGGRQLTRSFPDIKTYRDVKVKGCWIWISRVDGVNGVYGKIAVSTEDAPNEIITIRNDAVPKFQLNRYYLDHELPKYGTKLINRSMTMIFADAWNRIF
ncbi:hypothetical protein [Massilia glaciei]|uniref:hypothetical protein n=1 Tax=Massilia glaciei TaxID=1524097 RepID=UPI0011B2659B|nr:hypothetical protein [Massilia glaciei]